VSKAAAYALWSRTVFRHRGRWVTFENGHLVRATSWPAFWRTVQRANALNARAVSGNITL